MRYVKKIPFSYPELADLVGVQPLPTELESLIANLSKPDGSPLVREWFQPGSQYYGRRVSGEAAWRDIASGRMRYLDTGVEIVTSAGINGQPTITMDGYRIFLPEPDATINQEAGTFMFVFQHDGVSTGNRFLMGPSSGTATATAAPSIYVTSTGLATRVGGGAGFQHNATDYLNNIPKLISVTLSATKGTSIRRNGVEVVRDTTRTLPLISGLVYLFGASGGAGTFKGYAGHALIFDDDMSKSEYIASLEKIEQGYLTAYGITPGA